MADFISGLLTMSKRQVDLEAIVDGFSHSLQLIEPWREASTNHPALVKVIQDMQSHGQIYCDAVDMSLRTAQDGYGFSRDAIDLCEFLLKPDCTMEDLLEYISDMQDTAKRAREDSTNTMDKFRLVHTGLAEATKQIPTEVDQLVEKEAGKRKRLMFRLPFLFKRSENMARKTKRDVEVEVVLAELRRAATDLTKLSESVNAFVAWWVMMETLLSGVETRADLLKHRNGQKLMITAMRDGWCRINEDYLQYQIRIMQLQDYYPSERRKMEDANYE